jgi:hypothetical protein
MCRLVHEYFGKNKHASYRHQMRVLRQTGSISEYWDKFPRLRHQLLLYNPHLDEGHFVDEFIAGLKDEIRSAIWLHRPQDLEIAHLLALLQEEEAVPYKKRSYSKHDFREPSRDSGKSKWQSRPNELARAESKRTEGRLDDKLEALRTFRRSKGLCFTCGKKNGVKPINVLQMSLYMSLRSCWKFSKFKIHLIRQVINRLNLMKILSCYWVILLVWPLVRNPFVYKVLLANIRY